MTLVELRMRLYSGQIRAKPLWWEKVKDAAIIAKWRGEIVENDRAAVERLWGGDKRFDALEFNEVEDVKRWPRDPISDAQLDYIFDELKHDAYARDPDTGIFVSVPRCAT